MPYNNPSKRFLILQSAPWYDVRALFREVNALRKINFSITEQRQQALERLNSVPSECPFAADHRFPEHQLFVSEAMGDWARKFQQLKSALSYKERDIRAHTNVRDGGRDEKAEVSLGFSDSQQAFWNATTAMIDQLTRADDVFDRVAFEATLNLQWA